MLELIGAFRADPDGNRKLTRYFRKNRPDIVIAEDTEYPSFEEIRNRLLKTMFREKQYPQDERAHFLLDFYQFLHQISGYQKRACQKYTAKQNKRLELIIPTQIEEVILPEYELLEFAGPNQTVEIGKTLENQEKERKQAYTELARRISDQAYIELEQLGQDIATMSDDHAKFIAAASGQKGEPELTKVLRETAGKVMDLYQGNTIFVTSPVTVRAMRPYFGDLGVQEASLQYDAD